MHLLLGSNGGRGSRRRALRHEASSTVAGNVIGRVFVGWMGTDLSIGRHTTGKTLIIVW